MSFRDAWTVFSHDLTHTLRDRRTWITMVFIPLLIVPVILIATPTAFENQARRLADSRPEVVVVGAEYAPGLGRFIAESEEVRVVQVADPAGALAAGEVKAVVRIAPGEESGLGTSGESGAGGGAQAGAGAASGAPLEVAIEYDASSQASEYARARLEALAAAYANLIVAERLAELGVDPSILTPVRTVSRNVAPEERIGGFFLAMIMPMMLAVWIALGGMYAAIDGVAGEKERGTLEPLLATPLSRGSLVAGKYLAVLLTSVVAGGIAVVGMYAAFVIKPEALMGSGAGARFSISPGNALVIIGISVLLAAFFSAIELALSTVARSFREAQGYLSPISVAIVIPGVTTQFVDPAEAAAGLFYVPVVNAIFVFKEALLGSVDWGHVAVTAGSSLLWVALALVLAVHLFRRESVLFRT